ncbi:MAG: gamma-glutamyltransferase [bacterium]
MALNPSAGGVAAGHPATAQAARDVLDSGGNAYDAIIAATYAACVAEPLLASLGGGGFMLAKTPGKPANIYDFFTQTPIQKQTQSDLRKINGDFGNVTQSFYVGLGSFATPGIVSGLFQIHKELGRMPMTELAQPAINLSKGIQVNAFQAYIFSILDPILRVSPRMLDLFHHSDGIILKEGQLFKNPEFGEFLDHLTHEGAALFYKGEVAKILAQKSSQHGGHIRSVDLLNYQTLKHKALKTLFLGSTVWTNTLPSLGGPLISWVLQILNQTWDPKWVDDPDQLWPYLAEHFKLANSVRSKSKIELHPDQKHFDTLFSKQQLGYSRDSLNKFRLSSRGTTHISVIDKQGEMASLTLSNGEGCGYVLPGTGILLNNMLGEEDLSPWGIGHWPNNTRLSSMMAPSICQTEQGNQVVLGSGGSNRIRSALSQVIIRRLALGQTIQQSVNAPRLHVEAEQLDYEPGFSSKTCQLLKQQWSNSRQWSDPNLFFGGVHALELDSSNHLTGIGDFRRGGVALF